MGDLASSLVNHVVNDVEKGVDGTAKNYAGPELDKRGTALKRSPTAALKMRLSNKVPKARPLPRRRKDIVTRRGHVFEFKEEDIFEVTQYHKEYSVGATTLQGLAKFDDCDEYGISEESHQRLVRKEIRKLIQTATNDEPFLFDCKHKFAQVDGNGFEEASNLMDQIRCNLEIITHDNARIGVEHCPIRMEQMISEFKKSRRQLVARFKQDEHHVKGCQPKILEPRERNAELYHASVDYILGSIARVLVRSATSGYWEKHIFAILALWAVKLKALTYEPARCAAMSLSNGEDVIDRIVGNFDSKKAIILKVKLSPEAQEQEFDTLDAETALTSIYYEENIMFRTSLYYLVLYGVNAMFAGHQSTKIEEIGPECFETCTLLYRTGLDEVLTGISNDRYGDIYACSEPLQLNCMYGALELLMRNVNALKHRAKAEDLPSDGLPVGAVVTWEWPEDMDQKEPSDDGCLSLLTVEDIISLAVLQCLSTGYSAFEIESLIKAGSAGTSEQDPIMQFKPPGRNFQAMFNLATEDFLRRQKAAVVDRYHDREVQSVSASPLKRGIRAGTDLMLERVSKDEPEGKTRAMIKVGANNKQQMDSWVISEDSILVHCRGYVAFVIACALTIVCGSMAAPFAVGSRIRSVDPFQIATFGWVLAGFVVVLAKSRYVTDWPWHHFLRGRVICRSINDVHKVTGVDVQMIIMYLLHDEYTSILRTRGPFNGVFGRKAEGTDGFSIDVPVQLSTMLASGFIVLKVVNEKGEHLICEDIRKGAWSQVIRRGVRGKFLAYMDFGKDALEENSNEDHEEYEEAETRSDSGTISKPETEAEKVLHLTVPGIDPKVLQAIASGLFSAEPELAMTSLALAGAMHQVLKGDLFCIRSSCVRKYSIFGNIVANEVLGQAELASAVAF